MSKKKPPRPPAERETRVFPPSDGKPVAIDDHRFGVAPYVPPPDADREPDFAGPEGPARFSKTPFASTEPPGVVPVGRRGDKGFVYELDALWTGRLHTLAKHAGIEPAAYLTALLRRQWTAAPLTAKVPR